VAILTSLGLPGDAAAWTKLGFTVERGDMRIGRVRCTLGGEPSWGFDRAHADTAALGVPTALSPATTEQPQAGPSPADPASGPHPNGVTGIDHVVYTVPDLDSAVARLSAVLGAPPNRRFRPRGAAGPEMAFYRVGEAFIEVVTAGARPALIGVAFGAPDLDTTVAAIRAAGGPVGDAKPAVQGGRIASVRHGYLRWGVAVLEPPARDG
jgi:catechol 2,3-dioxygenase-like lactoylglutathione lyase family enzyme